MRVAITGATSGLGLAISEHYDTVLNFSRSNGFNIALYPRIIKHIDDIDLFYNNAHHGYCQVHLFYELVRTWRDDPTKTIVNISSDAPEKSESFNPYAATKAALDYASVQCIQDESIKCNILNFKPGYIDTPRVAHIEENKMPVDKAAEIIVKYVNECKNSVFTF